MRTTLTIGEPAVLSRCSLLEACTKLAVALDETMEPVPEIGGVDRVRMHAVRNGSSDLYIQDFGFPLSLNCQITDGLGKTVTGMYARLYINRDTGEAWAWVDDASREEIRGDIDTVVKSLSAAILKQLQGQFSAV